MIKNINSLLNLLEKYDDLNEKIKLIIRLIWWKFNQMFIKIPSIIEINKGIKCICYPNSSYGSLIIYNTWPEYYEMKFLLSILDEDSVFIDVGAGLGDYSLLASSVIKKGKIYAFEPANEPYKNFSENISLNNLQAAIILNNFVVSSENGKIDFVSEDVSEVSHIGYSKDTKTSKHNSITLDDFVLNKHIKKIKLLKIDTEGAESLVLRGATKIFKKGLIENIILELNSNSSKYNSSHNEILKYLKSFGYNIYRYDKNGKKINVKDVDQKETLNVVCSLKG